MTPLGAIGEGLRARLGLDPATLGARALGHAIRGRATARGLDGAAAYLAALADDPAEWEALVEAVVVPETWFFRDHQPFVLLARRAAREWCTRDAHDPVSILSLPCATGEEAWSIAIALAAAGVPPAAFRIDALDVSARALEVARTGRYPMRALRGRRLDPDWANYLEGAAGAERGRSAPSPPARRGTDPTECVQVAPALHASVRFARGNLREAGRALAGRRFDCVFSRNLLIYCDEPTRAAAIVTFAELLRPDGLLVLGHAETLPANTAGFVREGPPAAFAWRRVAATPAPARRVVAPRPAAQHAAPPRTARAHKGRSPRNADLAEASALADRGHLAEAAALAAAHIERAPQDAAAHALLGIVCAAQGRDAEAVEHLRRALYLAPMREDALVHLALILERRGGPQAAARLRDRARAAAERGPRASGARRRHG